VDTCKAQQDIGNVWMIGARDGFKNDESLAGQPLGLVESPLVTSGDRKVMEPDSFVERFRGLRLGVDDDGGIVGHVRVASWPAIPFILENRRQGETADSP